MGNMQLPIRRFLAPSLLILLSCCGSGVADGQTFTVEAMGGSAYNFPTPLTVSQSGYPDIVLGPLRHKAVRSLLSLLLVAGQFLE